MFKKLLVTFLILLMLYSTAVLSYRIFEPNVDDNITDSSGYLDYDSLSFYITSSGEGVQHFLLFYSANDNNSVYVKDTVLTTVANETKLNLSKIIEVVDISDIDSRMSLSRLSADWGISHYPALAAVTSENGKPVVLNKLEYNDESPLSALVVKNWLEQNNLYDPDSN